MRTTVVKATLTFLCPFLLAAGLASPSEAGVIPWLYQAVFGPTRGPVYYGSYYAPSMGYYTPSVSYYSPTVTYYAPSAMPSPCGPAGCGVPATSCASSCQTCAPCSVTACSPRVVFRPLACDPCGCGFTCGPACCPTCCSPCDCVGCSSGDCSVGCPSGDCSVSKPASPPKTGKAGPKKASPKTFSDKAKVPTPIDEGFRPRAGETKDAAPVQTEAFKVPETVIPKRQPAPTETPVEESQPPKESVDEVTPKLTDPATPIDIENKGEKDTPPAAPKAANPEPSEAGLLPVPALKFDEKVTWRVIPSHTRVTLRPRFSAPTLTRTVTDPNAEWMAVPAGPQIVQK